MCISWECMEQTLYTVVLFLQVLHRCHLSHCVSLWQLLSSLKSENLLRLKRVSVAFAECWVFLNVKQEHDTENQIKTWAWLCKNMLSLVYLFVRLFLFLQ